MKLIIIAVFIPLLSNAATFYVSQSGGVFSGGTVCNGKTAVSVATLNAATASAGDINYLCGTLSTGPKVTASGTNGNVISYIWDSGAMVSLASGQIINLNGAKSFLLFDGGIPCGAGTSCNSIEAANPTGYATGQAGIVEATANGSALANQSAATQAFYGCNGCHDIEIRNLIIRNMYVHSSLTDTTSNIDTGTFAFQCPNTGGCGSGVISVHDSTIHDIGTSISVETTSTTTVNIYNNDFYNMNWAMEDSGAGVRTISLHDSSCHDTTNWDTNADAFHHNCLHEFMTTGHGSDSLSTSVYNVQSYGNWGSCCTTATLIYGEIASPSNFNIFNNVCLQFSGNVAPCVVAGLATGLVANNTMLGVTPSNNVVALQLGGTNLTIENNAISGYGQYIFPVTGTTFVTFDYNWYGTTEGNGNSPWQFGVTGANTFAQWKTACSCDSHGGKVASLGFSALGVPLLGSSLIGAGANLTGLLITALDSDITGFPRPSSAAWDVGAYAYQAAATGGASMSGGVWSGGVWH